MGELPNYLEDIKNSIVGWGKPKFRPEIFVFVELKYVRRDGIEDSYYFEEIKNYVEMLFEDSLSWYNGSVSVSVCWDSYNHDRLSTKTVKVKVTGDCKDKRRFNE